MYVRRKGEPETGKGRPEKSTDFAEFFTLAECAPPLPAAPPLQAAASEFFSLEEPAPQRGSRKGRRKTTVIL